MRIAILFFILPFFSYSQFGDRTKQPESWTRDFSLHNIPTREVLVSEEDIEKRTNLSHTAYVCAVAVPTDIDFSEFVLSEILPNGDKVYRFIIQSPNAQGMMIYLENFKLQSGCKLCLYNINKTSFAGIYTAKDNYNPEDKFLTSYALGDKIIVEYIEPKDIQTKEFTISKVYHYFRGLKSSNGTGFGEAPACMINANCPEGNAKPAARDATCRIIVTWGSSSGFCSGTLVNNTAEDKTPYILTANHCSANSQISDLINWEYHFLYQSPNCNNPSVEPNNYISFKGSTAVAYSGTDNGDASSDFLLVKLNSSLTAATYNFTFLGWDRTNANFAGNICYHHPKGDIKKVSTSNGATVFTSYGGIVPNTHFKVIWSPTIGGHSSTAEGSSGSGLVNSNGQLVGTLTAGNASCDNLSGDDLYGRFYNHWDKFGLNSNQRLKPWLDPLNTGASSLRAIKLDGSTAIIHSNVSDKIELLYSRWNNQYRFSLNQNGFELTVYDILGNKLLSQSTQTKDITIDFSSLTKGFYWVEVVQNEMKYSNKLFWE